MVKNKLLEIRLQLGYKTAKEFSEWLGVNTNTYRKYEGNFAQPSLEVLVDIAKKLELKIEDIIYQVES